MKFILESIGQVIQFKTYKTPLYVYDEEGIIDKVETFKKKFVSSKFECEIVYASKSFLGSKNL